MRILVTGGAGFIGSWVVRRLAGRHRVAVYDDLSSGRRRHVPAAARLIVGDVRDLPTLRGAVGALRPDVVVHLAAQVNVRRSLRAPLEDFSRNVVGGLSVLEACAAARVRRLVFASSGGAVYGDQRRLPVPETAPASPVSPYGLSKLAVERFAARYPGLERVVLRLSNVYGPGQDPAGENGLVAILGDCVRRGVRPAVFGDGLQTRDYLHVEDAARAFERALTSPEGIYNVGSGVETSVLDLIRELSAATGATIRPRFRPRIDGEVRRSALDITHARRRLGWRPRISLGAGLRRTF